ncbi:MAG: hypothetical protein ABEH83_08915 [Halobacterium sp.]
MPYSPSRGLLYSAPPAHDERRTDDGPATDATNDATADAQADVNADADEGATPTPADD